MNSIHQRLPLIDERVIRGRREGNLITDVRNPSAIGTIVERMMLLVTLAKMDTTGRPAAVNRVGTLLNRSDALSPRRATLPRPQRMLSRASLGGSISAHRTIWGTSALPSCPCRVPSIALSSSIIINLLHCKLESTLASDASLIAAVGLHPYVSEKRPCDDLLRRTATSTRDSARATDSKGHHDSRRRWWHSGRCRRYGRNH